MAGMYDVDRFIADERLRETAARVGRRHYSALVPRIKALRKSRDVDAARALLEKCIQAIEREAQIPLPGATVPPWFFEQLAAIHRKAGHGQDADRVTSRYEELRAQVERSGARALEDFRQWAAKQCAGDETS